MNNLSWLLYWADVAPQIATFICAVSFLLTIASALALFFNLIGGEETRTGWEEYFNAEQIKEERVKFYKYTDEARVCRKLWFARITTPLFILLWASSFLVPSKDTIYLIAASQTGEQVLKTPEVAKIRLVINKYLDKEIVSNQGKTDNVSQ